MVFFPQMNANVVILLEREMNEMDRRDEFATKISDLIKEYRDLEEGLIGQLYIALHITTRKGIDALEQESKV